MTLPAQMADRWACRPEPAPGEGTVYWHLLMRDHQQVIELARQAQQRLAGFSGLHMTPLKWLHMTTLVAGPAALFSDHQLQQMTRAAAEHLADTPPITVSLGRILYHPEAIMLGVTPAQALAPIYEAAHAATRTVLCSEEPSAGMEGWTPHITFCYSTASQPASPIIDALGLHMPSCDVEIDRLSLVIQHGPERDWSWTPVGNVRLTEPASR
jgi:2'-5' RNA ligase